MGRTGRSSETVAQLAFPFAPVRLECGAEIYAVPDWPGYWATEEGEVWSSKRGGFRKLKPFRVRVGGKRAGPPRWCVSLCMGKGRARTVRVHQVVAWTFLGPPMGREVDHEDHDRDNNAWWNLRYLEPALNNSRTPGKPDPWEKEEENGEVPWEDD